MSEVVSTSWALDLLKDSVEQFLWCDLINIHDKRLFGAPHPGAFFQRYTTVSGLDGKLKYEPLACSGWTQRDPNLVSAQRTCQRSTAFVDLGLDTLVVSSKPIQTRVWPRPVNAFTGDIRKPPTHAIGRTFRHSWMALIADRWIHEFLRKGSAVSDFQQHSRQKRPCHADLIVLDPESGFGHGYSWVVFTRSEWWECWEWWKALGEALTAVRCEPSIAHIASHPHPPGAWNATGEVALRWRG